MHDSKLGESAKEQILSLYHTLEFTNILTHKYRTQSIFGALTSLHLSVNISARFLVYVKLEKLEIENRWLNKLTNIITLNKTI